MSDHASPTGQGRWVSDEAHRAELERASGISAEVASAAGLWSESDPSVLSKLTGRPKKVWTPELLPALVFPYYVPGEDDPVLFNVKPQRPLPSQTKEGAVELLKYVRSSLPIRIYFPPGLRASERQRRDTSRALFITEGEKKTLAAESKGLLCLGLTGVSCWSVKEGKKRRLHPDFEHVALKGRRVFVIFDSDSFINIMNVRREEKALAAALAAAGAEVSIVRLPDAPDGSKQGLDDFLVAQGRPALEKLCNAAKPFARPTKPGAVAAPAFATDLTDAGNAERLAKMFGGDLRYLPARKCWLGWDGRRWEPIADEEVMALALKVVASIFDEAAEAGKRGDGERSNELQKHATRSRSAAGLANMIKVARALPGITVRPDQLDSDPWLFNCANGVLDLRTRELMPHDRDLLITKVSPVHYDPRAVSIAWDGFVKALAAGREGYAEFLQTVAGYALSGDTSEEKFVLMTGEGGAGKGTFADAIRAVLGDYAQVADFDTFMRQERGGGGPTEDLARLAGARAVFASESEDGKRMSEARVKSITGGDTIAASFKYGHIFEFKPQFKLFLASNYPPAVREDDTGLWRRMLHAPFDQKPAEPNPDLKARFRDPGRDAPAVFAWMVEGFALWMRERIKVPECVRLSTEQYRADQDMLADFFAEKCVFKPSACIPTHDLKVAYKEWRAETGERFAPGWKRVCERLRQANCESKPGFYKGKRKRLWVGVGLAADVEGEEFRDDDGWTDHKTQNGHAAPGLSRGAHAGGESEGDVSDLCFVSGGGEPFEPRPGHPKAERF